MKSIREIALNLISISARSKHELRSRLIQKKFNLKDIDDVIEDLEDMNLLDDRKFAFSWIENKLFKKPCGKKLFENQLREKGINKVIIDEVLEEVFIKKDEQDMANEVAQNKWKIYSKYDPETGKRRLLNYLLRNGFGHEVSMSAVNSVGAGR